MALGHRKMMAFIVLLPAALAVDAAEEEIALTGYSPFSYFTEDRTGQGGSRYFACHDGQIYDLTPWEQAHRFRDGPDDYVPALAGLCPYSLALGRSVAVDPERFEIVDGRLYLFHNAAEFEVLRNPSARQEDAEGGDHQSELFRF